MYGRFASLSAQSLLVQQVEILGLERKLRVQAAVDRTSNLSFDEKALELMHSADPDDDQWRLVLRIREASKEYSE